MKRLHLPEEPQPIPASETHKDSLIRAIKEYIGTDGCIAFEHGYRPTFNAQMITDKEVILRFRIGKKKISRIPLEDLDEQMLTKLIIEIFKYQNYCQLRA